MAALGRGWDRRDMHVEAQVQGLSIRNDILRLAGVGERRMMQMQIALDVWGLLLLGDIIIGISHVRRGNSLLWDKDGMLDRMQGCCG